MVLLRMFHIRIDDGTAEEGAAFAAASGTDHPAVTHTPCTFDGAGPDGERELYAFPSGFGDASVWDFLFERNRGEQSGILMPSTCDPRTYAGGAPCAFEIALSPPDKLDISVRVALQQCGE